jgi:hypothetical protein
MTVKISKKIFPKKYFQKNISKNEKSPWYQDFQKNISKKISPKNCFSPAEKCQDTLSLRRLFDENLKSSGEGLKSMATDFYNVGRTIRRNRRMLCRRLLNMFKPEQAAREEAEAAVGGKAKDSDGDGKDDKAGKGGGGKDDKADEAYMKEVAKDRNTLRSRVGLAEPDRFKRMADLRYRWMEGSDYGNGKRQQESVRWIRENVVYNGTHVAGRGSGAAEERYTWEFCKKMEVGETEEGFKARQAARFHGAMKCLMQGLRGTKLGRVYYKL